VLGGDAGFAWRHWQVWAEAYRARFAIPLVGNADTVAGYVEMKYKFTPQFFAALRWNQQFFDRIARASGQSVAWGRNIRRIDVAPAYRLTPHVQLKLQYSLQHEDGGPDSLRQLIAGQCTVRF